MVPKPTPTEARYVECVRALANARTDDAVEARLSELEVASDDIEAIPALCAAVQTVRANGQISRDGAAYLLNMLAHSYAIACRERDTGGEMNDSLRSPAFLHYKIECLRRCGENSLADLLQNRRARYNSIVSLGANAVTNREDEELRRSPSRKAYLRAPFQDEPARLDMIVFLVNADAGVEAVVRMSDITREIRWEPQTVGQWFEAGQKARELGLLTTAAACHLFERFAMSVATSSEEPDEELARLTDRLNVFDDPDDELSPEEAALAELWKRRADVCVSSSLRKHGETALADLLDQDPARFHALSEKGTTELGLVPQST